MSGAGEVVALAVAAVDLAEFRLVAQALVAAALSTAAADLLALGLPASAHVRAPGVALLALATGAKVTRLTVTSPTVICTCKEKRSSRYMTFTSCISLKTGITYCI